MTVSKFLWVTAIVPTLVFRVFAQTPETEAPILIPPPAIVETKNRILSDEDVKIYKKIFSAMDRQDIDEIKMLSDTVRDPVLKGYPLATIYLADSNKVTRKELTAWLKKYGTLPIADKIYDLAVKKKATLPIKKPSDPSTHITAGICTSIPIADPIDLVFIKRGGYVPEENRAKVRKSMTYFATAIKRGKTLAAKLHLNERHVTRNLSQRDKDDSLTALAFAYFIDRQDQKAIDTVKEVLPRSENRNPSAFWTAGLTSFRMKKWADAEEYFKKLLNHPKAIATQKSAAAFWVTRALMKQEKFKEINNYLRISATSSPRFFYGILAQRALGWSIGHTWKSSPVEQADIGLILKETGGKRAIALLETDRPSEAEKELIKLYAENKNLRKHLRAYADSLFEYPEISAKLAGLSGKIETPEGENALYPVPNWIPENGWQIDKALVFAFVRQESCFKNKAFSKAGARGVMQMMPSTARLMAKRLKKTYQLSRLHRIPYNLMMGQELVRTLLNYKAIDGNLLMAIAAYNCGPGNTVKWQKRPDFINDPLMFVEGIPSRETRGFVKKVTANYWIYRSLFNEDLSSIDDVLAGKYPIYKED